MGARGGGETTRAGPIYPRCETVRAGTTARTPGRHTTTTEREQAGRTTWGDSGRGGNNNLFYAMCSRSLYLRLGFVFASFVWRTSCLGPCDQLTALQKM
jgi:hypothetical protein